MRPDEILADPEWLPHRLLGDAHTIAFRRTPREGHRNATFLDDTSLGPGETAALPIAALADLSTRDGPIHFIFHSAFCCSTLLARALDLPGVTIGLKEPTILNDLADHWRAHGPTDALAPILTLLARPFEGDRATVVKPSNVANNLIDAILAARPDARVLLQYAPLRPFLVSVVKKGMWGRIWVRKLYRLLQQHPGFAPGFGAAELFEQSDIQIAALGWLQQQAQFAALIRRHGERIRTLDSETLLAQRGAALASLGEHFDLPLEQHAADPSIFEQHSKRLGERYDPATRQAETAHNASAHEEELAMVERWASTIASQFNIPLALDRALLTSGRA